MVRSNTDSIPQKCYNTFMCYAGETFRGSLRSARLLHGRFANPFAKWLSKGGWSATLGLRRGLYVGEG